jgi:hypothetical protein
MPASRKYGQKSHMIWSLQTHEIGLITYQPTKQPLESYGQ